MKINAGSNLTLEFEFEEYVSFVGYVSADPTSPVVTVTDPAGTVKITSEAATKHAIGKWYYELATAIDWIDGIYEVKVTSDEDVTVYSTAFEII